MKKLTFLCLVLCCCLFLNGFITVAPKTDVIIEPAVNMNKVQAARFENILNHNTVYGDAFYDNQLLVNAAMIVLKNYADDDGFVKEEIVTTYIKDMYDIDIDINEKINEGLPYKDGYVLLIPRGHSEYEHSVTSIKTYDDYILVKSTVKVKTHDNGEYMAEAVTKFAENEKSAFGYSIISSDINEQNEAIKM